MSKLKTFALGDFHTEITNTRVVLSRIPPARLDWKPHDKSWTIGELGTHLANLPTWQISTMQTDGFDMSAPQPPRPALESVHDILAAFDTHIETLTGILEKTTEEDLLKPWTLRSGDTVFWTRPRIAVFREWGISHMIHHRGQLTVYLRLLDVPVPPTYGPTADETPS